MQFQYSSLLDPDEYDLRGVCDPSLKVRRNNYPQYEVTGTLRAQEDWKRYVGSIKEPCWGGISPYGNFMAIAIPECIPERLEIVSYANEIAFLHDDITDISSIEQVSCPPVAGLALTSQIKSENSALLQVFLECTQNGNIISAGTGKTLLLKQMFEEMTRIDSKCARALAKMWAEFIICAGTRGDEAFQTLNDYLPYRVHDVGEMFWCGLITFSMALTIPDEEMNKCRALCWSAYAAFVLQNDLFSWEKEYREANKYGCENIPNAIAVLMREHNINVEEAKSRCLILIREYETKYLTNLHVARNSKDLSLGLKAYMEALQFTSTGNALWSLTCPRYHALDSEH